MLLCSCDIPGRPVSVNRIWRNGQGHMYKAQQARDFEMLAINRLQQAKERSVWEDDVVFVLEVWRTDFRRYDLDNCVKQVQDCLAKAGIIKDDSQVASLHAEKRWIVEDDVNEYVHVEAYGRIRAKKKKRKGRKGR